LAAASGSEKEQMLVEQLTAANEQVRDLEGAVQKATTKAQQECVALERAAAQAQGAEKEVKRLREQAVAREAEVARLEGSVRKLKEQMKVMAAASGQEGVDAGGAADTGARSGGCCR